VQQAAGTNFKHLPAKKRMKNLLLMAALFTAMTACKKTSNAPLAEDAASL